MDTTSNSELFNPNEHQHMRYNPLKDEWVLVSPHRSQRPWSGQVEAKTESKIEPHDPKNPLCPGSIRASGLTTPNYTSTHVFTNDFPALLEEGPEPPKSEDPLFQILPAKGTCRVMCFHPKSDVYLHTMSNEEVEQVIGEWVIILKLVENDIFLTRVEINQTKILGEKYSWVQIFENRGAIMGCSNPHPHCQIWASNFMPNEPRIKDQNFRKFYTKYGRPMLQDYAEKELRNKERVVYENCEWLVVVPYWAVWPFETMILPKVQVQRFTDLNTQQRKGLISVLKVIVAKYDNLFKCTFPYSMGWHGAPTGDNLSSSQNHWTFHGIYLPPLLRSESIKKFMVGYELLAQSQRDLTPEKAAGLLRDQSNHHY